MIWLRKTITSYFQICCWFLIYILLVDFANLLSIRTEMQVYTVEEGESFSYLVQFRNPVSSSFIDTTPEPNNLENGCKTKSVYDIDGPLLSRYTEIRDHSFSFFHLQLYLFSPIELFEIIYLQNCILLI